MADPKKRPYGEAAPVYKESIERKFDPSSATAMGMTKAMLRDSFTPDMTKGQNGWLAEVCYAWEEETEAGSSYKPSLLSWALGEESTEQIKELFVVAYIQELGDIRPTAYPINNDPNDSEADWNAINSLIAKRPPFTAKDPELLKNFGIPSPGERVYVDFEHRDLLRGPIYLGPVNAERVAPTAANTAPGTASARSLHDPQKNPNPSSAPVDFGLGPPVSLPPNPLGGPLPSQIVDKRAEVWPLKPRKGNKAPSRNRVSRIDTICLHQMATKSGRADGPSDWKRWGHKARLEIHWYVSTGTGEPSTAYLFQNLDTKVWHGHAWNSRSVGFEIEGWFAGIHADPSTFWKPKNASGARAIPMTPTPSQVEAVKQAIRYTYSEIQRMGGQIKYIGCHRQARSIKASDPGELIWKAIALPMMAELGLQQAPTLGGKAIPEAWDSRNVGVPYR